VSGGGRGLRILHLEAGSQLSGGPRQLLYLLEGLAARGVDNTLLCPAHSPLVEAARPHARVVPVAMQRWRRIPLLLALTRTLASGNPPDLLHIHSRRGADYVGGLAARVAALPCVLSRRVAYPEPTLVARTKYRLFHRVVAISEGIRQGLLAAGVADHRLACVRSAIDPGPWQTAPDRAALEGEFRIPPGSLVAGAVGRLVSTKGHTLLLTALARLAADFPRLHLVVFGVGPLEAELADQSARLGLAERVHLVGFRQDLERWLPSLDLVVHPALMEGLGVSLIQAAAAGIPIVASRTGGIPEIVREGENGLLVAPGDAQGLARAMAELLGNPERRRILGLRGRQIVHQEFSLGAMVEGNLAVYRQLLGCQAGT
jgi:glycosyltransferase involved in cell wall biosynthesis